MCKSFVVIYNLRGRVTHLTMVIKSPKEWPGRTEPRQPAWGRSGRNNAPDSQWPASRSTIGRDTDTVACMAAGICGALSGISPRDLLLFERKGLVKRTAHPEMPPSSRGNKCSNHSSARGGGPRCRVQRVCMMPNARCGPLPIRGSSVGGVTRTQGNYGVQSHQAGAAHGRVPGIASPHRPALGLPNGSRSLPPAVRLKLWRKLWRILLINRLSAGRSGRI
jgi:hypothetical protein